MKYLLPCEKCGEKTPIDVNQAGQQIACQCGQMLEIPSLRGIRELEVIDGLGSTSVSRPAWGVGRRVVFVVGLVVSILSLVVLCFAILTWSQMDPSHLEAPEWDATDLEQISAEIDAKTPAQAWDEWSEMRAQGLGHYFPPQYIHARRFLGILQTVIAVAASVVIGGILMSVGACLFRGAGRSR